LVSSICLGGQWRVDIAGVRPKSATGHVGSSGVVILADGRGNSGGWCPEYPYRVGKADIGMSSMAVIGASSNAVIGGVQRSAMVGGAFVDEAGGEMDPVVIASFGRMDTWVGGIGTSGVSHGRR
jgi:hypothetical protein